MLYSVNEAVAQWRIVDGEAVIVNVDSSYYYGLNGSGTTVWTLLAEAPRTLDDVASRLAEAYGLDAGRARDDVRQVIDHLMAEGLVKEA